MTKAIDLLALTDVRHSEAAARASCCLRGGRVCCGYLAQRCSNGHPAGRDSTAQRHGRCAHRLHHASEEITPGVVARSKQTFYGLVRLIEHTHVGIDVDSTQHAKRGELTFDAVEGSLLNGIERLGSLP